MTTKKTVWVLTREVNAYDQEGAYFVAVFETKPTIVQLAEYLKSKQIVEHKNIMEGIVYLERLLSGGGRRGNENDWYNLSEEAFS